MDVRIDAISIGVNTPIIMDALIRHTKPSFIEKVMRVKVSSRFKLPPELGVYERKMDPMDHLDSYENLMMLQEALDKVMCRAFLTILRRPTRSWFKKLPPRTINSFGNQSRFFLRQFLKL